MKRRPRDIEFEHEETEEFIDQMLKEEREERNRNAEAHDGSEQA